MKPLIYYNNSIYSPMLILWVKFKLNIIRQKNETLFCLECAFSLLKLCRTENREIQENTRNTEQKKKIIIIIQRLREVKKNIWAKWKVNQQQKRGKNCVGEFECLHSSLKTSLSTSKKRRINREGLETHFDPFG